MNKYVLTDIQWFSRENGTEVPFLFNKSYDKIKFVLDEKIYDLDKGFQDFGNKSTKLAKEQVDMIENSLQKILGNGSFESDNIKHVYKIYAEVYDPKAVNSEQGLQIFKETMASHGAVSKRFVKDIADELTRLKKKHNKKLAKMQKIAERKAEKLAKKQLKELGE